MTALGTPGAAAPAGTAPVGTAAARARGRRCTVDAAGLPVTCTVWGQGDEPVLLVPDLAGAPVADHGAFLVPALARRHEVVGIDPVEPPADRPLRLDDLVQQLASAVEQAAAGRPVAVVGSSLGAAAGAALAAARPDLVAHLVLVAGWLVPSATHRLHARVWRTLHDERSAALPEHVVGAVHDEAYLAQRSPADLAALAAAVPTDRFARRLVDLAVATDLTDVLPRVHAPTLVVGATQDRLVTEPQSRALFAALPDSRYLAVRAGHAVAVERPAELAWAVESFLADPGRYPAGTILPVALP